MKKTSVLPIQHWQTSQGVPVYYIHTPQLPMMDLRVVFKAGSAYDGNQSGLAELTNSLLDEGCADLTAEEIARRLDGCGAIYRANVGIDSASVGLRSLTDSHHLTEALVLLRSILGQPTFSANDFDRLQSQQLTSLQAEQQQPTAIAKKAYYSALYVDHVYAQPTSGTADSVKRLTRDAVAGFYQRYYCAQNALVVLVGAIDLAQAETIAEQITQVLPQGTAAVDVTATKSHPATEQHINFPSQQSTLLLGQVAHHPTRP